ncbi:hypothetical protein ACFWUU_15090 [Kribbella sp. NPDC058693]|uniref:hypothetical protein n=1 Tax=Kribbella sp. NPDC058693 TaxID=3346602 RepID=UPI0036597AB4
MVEGGGHRSGEFRAGRRVDVEVVAVRDVADRGAGGQQYDVAARALSASSSSRTTSSMR